MTKSSKQLEQLFAAIGNAKHILILPHNNPDPDAIASAVALKHLLQEKLSVTSQIAYKGIIGRAENKALVRYLNQPLRRLMPADLNGAAPIALVDTQPGAGNNALPPHIPAAIVIDHHPLQNATATATFSDVRPDVGSTASIMVRYFNRAGIPLDVRLATALFYGIKTDTMGLERGVSSLDTTSFCRLLPQIDIEALFKVEQAQVPAGYFKSFAITLQNAHIYNNVVTAYVGEMDYPDLAAEMADFLLRMRGCQWIVCMGIYQEDFVLSVRTYNQRGAGQLVQEIVGARGLAGGHGAMAGGQVALQDDSPEELVSHFTRRALEYLNIPSDEPGQPLI